MVGLDNPLHIAFLLIIVLLTYAPRPMTGAAEVSVAPARSQTDTTAAA
jgi:hypothetical protein